MAHNPNPNDPTNWSVDEAFEVFNYTIECLTYFQDTRDVLIEILAGLPHDNLNNLLRVEGLLSDIRTQVALWDRCRELTNRILKQKLRT